MVDEKITQILKARCDECGSENVTITGSKAIETEMESKVTDWQAYYFQCNDCGNVFYIIKEPK